MEMATPYSTPADLATRAAVDEDMKQHVHQAHTLPMEMEKLAVARIEMEAKKVEAEASKISAEKAPSASNAGAGSETSDRWSQHQGGEEG